MITVSSKTPSTAAIPTTPPVPMPPLLDGRLGLESLLFVFPGGGIKTSEGDGGDNVNGGGEAPITGGDEEFVEGDGGGGAVILGGDDEFVLGSWEGVLGGGGLKIDGAGGLVGGTNGDGGGEPSGG